MNNLLFSNQSPTLISHNKCNTEKKKINVKKIKSTTINSLNEVENFLNEFCKFKKYIKLYKFLK